MAGREHGARATPAPSRTFGGRRFPCGAPVLHVVLAEDLLLGRPRPWGHARCLRLRPCVRRPLAPLRHGSRVPSRAARRHEGHPRRVRGGLAAALAGLGQRRRRGRLPHGAASRLLLRPGRPRGARRRYGGDAQAPWRLRGSARPRKHLAEAAAVHLRVKRVGRWDELEGRNRRRAHRRAGRLHRRAYLPGEAPARDGRPHRMDARRHRDGGRLRARLRLDTSGKRPRLPAPCRRGAPPQRPRAFRFAQGCLGSSGREAGPRRSRRKAACA